MVAHPDDRQVFLKAATHFIFELLRTAFMNSGSRLRAAEYFSQSL